MAPEETEDTDLGSSDFDDYEDEVVELSPEEQQNHIMKENQIEEEQKKKKSEVLDKFIRTIINRRKTPISRLIAVLEARGFIFEKVGKNYLVDIYGWRGGTNGKFEVFQLLEDLLKTNNIQIIGNGDIIFNQKLTIRKLKKIFFSRTNLGSYEFYWMNFDPYIARLVHAMRVVSIRTNDSCDGLSYHTGHGIYIQFNSDLDQRWFQFIYNKFIEPQCKPKFKWEIDKNFMLEIRNSQNDFVEIYLEIQMIAEFLFKNQEFFRHLKQCVEDNLEITFEEWCVHKTDKEIEREFDRFLSESNKFSFVRNPKST